jgi:hypothetical protein
MPVRGGRLEAMTERTTPVEQDLAPRDVEPTIEATADELVQRASAERAAGQDTSRDVDALLRAAADQNRAALDRLAQ